MRLLVTRPEPDASETAAALRARGHTVIVEPLLTIAFNPPPVDLPEPAILVATSRNGIRAIATWPQSAGWRALPIYTTGKATAEEARKSGFTDVRSADGDAAALANLIVDEVPKPAGPVIYAAARDRTGALGGGLTAISYDLRLVEAYRAERPTELSEATRDALRRHELDGALFYSRRTATTFRDLVESAGLTAALEGVILFALSERVAEPLRAISGVRVLVAPEPESDALLALVEAAG